MVLLVIFICANIIISLSICLLGLDSNNLITCLWLRLSLILVVYSLNVIFSLYIKMFSSNKTELDLSILSPNMLNAITFNRLIVMSISVSLFYSFKVWFISKFVEGFNFEKYFFFYIKNLGGL